MHESKWVYLWLTVGACATTRFSQQRILIAIIAGILVWWTRNPKFIFYLSLALGLVYFARKKPWLTISLTLFFIILWPKIIFSIAHDLEYWHNWLDATGLAFLGLGALYYWRERRDHRIASFTLSQWFGYFLFPSNPLNPINFAPSDFISKQSSTLPCIKACQGLLLAAAKAGVIYGCKTYLGKNYSSWSIENFPHAWFQLKLWQVWLHIFLTYFPYVLWLSATADVVVSIARFYGLNLPYNYRWALLAWNPVELWRRWAIYNRRLLLKTVYFPLGGRERHVYRNILLTFLASALMLHSGWVGSRYWTVGNDMVLLYSAYFLLQGLAVCACVMFWHHRGKDPSSDRQLRWSLPRFFTTLLTQGFAAWVHLLILCPYGTPWETRLKAMLYALGIKS